MNNSRVSLGTSKSAKSVALLLTLILTLVMALGLAGCSGNSGGSSASGTSDSASIANPVLEVADVAAINKELGSNLVIPGEATVVLCSVINGTIGEVTFEKDGRSFDYRVQQSDELIDISGLYYEFALHEESEASGQAFTVEYNDGGPGYAHWFDADAGMVYSVSIDSGANSELLMSTAEVLIQLQQ